MPNMIAITRCHYGADYLRWVIKSTEMFAYEHLILYTGNSTFLIGEDTSDNPDSRDKLYEIAMSAGPNRVRWIDCDALQLPVTIETAHHFAGDADLMLELDADEVIDPRLMEDILLTPLADLTAYSYRLPMIHYWRSFNYACFDQGWPIRLRVLRHAADPQKKEGEMWPKGKDYQTMQGLRYIRHFGYARSIADMRYKMKLSMHRAEFREGWWENKFLNFPHCLTDLHPVSVDFWNAQPISQVELPGIMWDHPYYHKAVIE